MYMYNSTGIEWCGCCVFHFRESHQPLMRSAAAGSFIRLIARTLYIHRRLFIHSLYICYVCNSFIHSFIYCIIYMYIYYLLCCYDLLIRKMKINQYLFKLTHTGQIMLYMCNQCHNATMPYHIYIASAAATLAGVYCIYTNYYCGSLCI